MSTNHPARNVRQMVGAASVAAFVGAAIAIATHQGSTQPANAAQSPATTPSNQATQNTSPYDWSSSGQDDGSWGATVPDDGGATSQSPSDQSQGGGFFGGGSSSNSGNGFTPPSHSGSGGS